MVNSSMLRGEVIDVKGHEYLVRLADGSTRPMHTDNRTFGNGPAYQGEDILAWLEKDSRVSVLTRIKWVPMKTEVMNG